VLESLRVSTSATRIVAGSKGASRRPPDLVPPIDRQYTFPVLHRTEAVTTGEERAFLEWFPYLAEIGRRAEPDIEARSIVVASWRRVQPRFVDNAIIGSMRGDGSSSMRVSSDRHETGLNGLERGLLGRTVRKAGRSDDRAWRRFVWMPGDVRVLRPRPDQEAPVLGAPDEHTVQFASYDELMDDIDRVIQGEG
jgi:hypothetical protein